MESTGILNPYSVHNSSTHLNLSIYVRCVHWSIRTNTCTHIVRTHQCRNCRGIPTKKMRWDKKEWEHGNTKRKEEEGKKTVNNNINKGTMNINKWIFACVDHRRWPCVNIILRAETHANLGRINVHDVNSISRPVARHESREIARATQSSFSYSQSLLPPIEKRAIGVRELRKRKKNWRKMYREWWQSIQ